MSVPTMTAPVAATPVTPGSRIVPALVGPTGLTQIAHIPCPKWCVVDHLVRVTCFDDVLHYSDADTVTVLTLMDDHSAHSELTVAIGCDPTARDPRLRAAHVLIGGHSTDACLTPDMSDELADEVIAFAIRMRVAARIAREHNADAG